jgi:two-component sensor histidine kinase
VQEALTNTIKHAAPARASVKVRWEGSALELEISDDGSPGRAVNGTTGGTGSLACVSAWLCASEHSKPARARKAGLPCSPVSR